MTETNEDFNVIRIKASKKIDSIIFRIFTNDPMLFESLNIFEKIPSKEQHTLGIDTRVRPPVIKYNPYFVNILSKERLECILTMEGLKIMLKHPTTRLCKPRDISALSSNITITPFSLDNILKENDMNEFYPKPDMFGLEKDKCFEEYFRAFMNKREETKEKIKEIWDSLSKEEKEQLIKNSINEYKQFKNSDDAMKEYFNPNSTNTIGWGENEELDADIKTLINNNTNNIDQWGNRTKNLYNEIIAAYTAKISWEEMLRRFATSVLSTRVYSSRMKVNRRYGFSQPGSRREYESKIIFGIDSSGSMSDDDLAEGFASINVLFGHAEIICVMFDTEIKSIEKNIKKAQQSFKVHGRGGTDFQEIINYADKEKADGLIIFTDGQANKPIPPIKAKVLWLLHSKDRGLKPPCDWGYVAHLERFE